MNDKPKMYQNKIDKEFHNNSLVYMTNNKDKQNNTIYTTNDIRNKINNLINGSSFIYQTKVNIVLEDETIERKIIGLYGNNLLTIDNEYIPIDKIIDIYK